MLECLRNSEPILDSEPTNAVRSPNTQETSVSAAVRQEVANASAMHRRENVLVSPQWLPTDPPLTNLSGPVPKPSLRRGFQCELA